MPDFQKGKIYKITNDYNDEVYIGHTCDTLVKRYSKHKSDVKLSKNINRPLYQLMNELGFERFRIELICNYPCEDKYQLCQKEGEYIRKLGTLNKIITGRTKNEYMKQYNIMNKEKAREYYIKNNYKIQQYRELNKDKSKEYRNAHKEKLQAYRDAHKDKHSEYDKQRYILLKERLETIITCNCGCKIRFDSKRRHEKSKKHIDLMNQLNIESVI
jgi:hypothetical protein